jgi:hypothetical protein
LHTLKFASKTNSPNNREMSSASHNSEDMSNDVIKVTIPQHDKAAEDTSSSISPHPSQVTERKPSLPNKGLLPPMATHSGALSPSPSFVSNVSDQYLLEAHSPNSETSLCSSTEGMGSNGNVDLSDQITPAAPPGILPRLATLKDYVTGGVQALTDAATKGGQPAIILSSEKLLVDMEGGKESHRKEQVITLHSSKEPSSCCSNVFKFMLIAVLMLLGIAFFGYITLSFFMKPMEYWASASYYGETVQSGSMMMIHWIGGSIICILGKPQDL